MGHHSTSDDSTRYRSVDEIRDWMVNNCPVERFRRYLHNTGVWDDARDEELRSQEHRAVLEALLKAETKPKPPVTEMFDDVYCELPPHLQRQKQQAMEHLQKHPVVL